METNASGARRRTVVVAALALFPGLVVGALSLWWTVGAAMGGGLWPPDDVSLSEAVATRNYGEVGRLLGLGTDPNRRSRVRVSLLANDRELTITPLEAAVWTRDSSLFRLLVEAGALIPRGGLDVLRCINERTPDAGVRAMLRDLSPEPWPNCSTVELPG